MTSPAVAEFIGAMAGLVPGLDDPSVLEDFMGGRDAADVVASVIMDMGVQRDAALEAFMAPHELTVVCHDRHPCLRQIAAWCVERPGALMLASPSGPPPNAVLVLEAFR